MRYAMVIDLDKCIGCQTCAVVCKMHHAQPQGTWWNRVFTQGSEYHQSAVGSEDGYKIEYLPVLPDVRQRPLREGLSDRCHL